MFVREILHLLVCWARMKLEGRNSIWVSNVEQELKHLNHQLLPPRGRIVRKLASAMKLELKARHSDTA